MTEIWLRTNRRILLLGMILPVVLMAIGLIVVFALATESGTELRIVGWLIVAAGLLLLAIIAFQLKLPRLAYVDRQVLIYLRTGGPIRIPVEYVECFFLASGSGQLPGTEGRQLPVRNLVMRVAEKATDYQQRQGCRGHVLLWPRLSICSSSATRKCRRWCQSQC